MPPIATAHLHVPELHRIPELGDRAPLLVKLHHDGITHGIGHVRAIESRGDGLHITATISDTAVGWDTLTELRAGLYNHLKMLPHGGAIQLHYNGDIDRYRFTFADTTEIGVIPPNPAHPHRTWPPRPRAHIK